MTPEDLTRRFTHHPPRTPATDHAHEALRAAAHGLARVINDLVPASREKTLALTRVEEALMWGNAGIAHHQDPTPN